MEGPLIVTLLVIAAAWGLYLFPTVFGGRRDAPLNSTEEFDRWTHLMADVQRRPFNARSGNGRDIIRARRRRTIAILAILAAGTLVLALWFKSWNWLLVHIGIDALIAWYVAMLAQIRQQHSVKVASEHAAEQPAGMEGDRVRIIAE